MCSITKENVFDAISTVIDPEVGFNLVEMGLIYDAIIDEESCDVKVIMTLSTQGCPLHQMIKQWVHEAVERIEDVGAIEVEVVWEPAWNISMADDNVKQALAGM
ncbi:MAG: metal-sulfur cluster assembly factor [Campylobacterota bacterium]|nr:metal-sulfur cluster assembly factor [Campylobacterota bacterium]